MAAKGGFQRGVTVLPEIVQGRCKLYKVSECGDELFASGAQKPKAPTSLKSTSPVLCPKWADVGM